MRQQSWIKIMASCTIASALSFMQVAAHASLSGNDNVPEPAKAVDLSRYVGKWYEFARYENLFEKNCEGVTADYEKRDDGLIKVVNTCHEGSVSGPARAIEGKAKVVPNSRDAKLKVSFFGPFYVGKYWVLDHADDYSWSIVGEPTGIFLWILTRDAKPSEALATELITRATKLGYDASMIRRTKH